MYKCEICGRETFKKIRLGGYTLCSKHMRQYHKHKRFLDSNPRTVKDYNNFVIEGDIAKFDVYNIRSEYVASFIVDAEDVERIRYIKWRISTHNMIMSPKMVSLSRLIMNCTDENLVVDHINCNTLDNRKCNLRICTQGENVCNRSFMSNSVTGIIGVTFNKTRQRYEPEIRKNRIRVHIGRYKTIEEATYARYVAEDIVFGEFRNILHDGAKNEMFSNISDKRKSEIETYITNKIHSKFSNECV